MRSERTWKVLAWLKPQPVDLSGVLFDPEARKLNTETDPSKIYKGLVENELRRRWVRPDGVLDLNFIAEVEITMDTAGNILSHDWKHGSGHAQWDDSVRQALRLTTKINRVPPKNFPMQFLVRFDVLTDATEPVLQSVQATKF